MENLLVISQTRLSPEPSSQVNIGNGRAIEDARDIFSEDSSTFAFSLATIRALQIERAASALTVYGTTPQESQTIVNTDTGDAASPPRQQHTHYVPLETATARSTLDIQNQHATPGTPARSHSAQSAQSQISPSAQQSALAFAVNSAASPAAPTSTAINSAARTLQSAPLAPAGGLLTRENPVLNRPASIQHAQPKTSVHETNFARLVATRLNQGETRFEVRLDPPELGRIDVRLVADARQAASLNLSFEHQSTRDMFRQDADALRALLQDHGFDLGSQDLTFDLEQQTNGPLPDQAAPSNEAFSSIQMDIPNNKSTNYVSPHHAVSGMHLLNITA